MYFDEFAFCTLQKSFKSPQPSEFENPNKTVDGNCEQNFVCEL